MPSRTNFGARRADRNRAQKARNEEKQQRKQARSEQRKAGREQPEGSDATEDDTQR